MDLLCLVRRVLLVGVAAVAPGVVAQEATIAGEFVIEPTTLIAAGFRWYVEGDSNGNATVQLQYRRAGSGGDSAGAWLEGLPLLRLRGEQMNNVVGAFTHVVANQFAGSLFDLEPDTGYEVRLTLSDSDGVQGTAQHTTMIRPTAPTGSTPMRRASSRAT